MNSNHKRIRLNGLSKPISPIALGTAFYRLDGQEQWFEILDAYLEAGGTLIDSARGYGASEEVIGNWLELRGSRDKVVLVTKCGLTAEGVLPAQGYADLVASELAKSLQTLRTGQIDIYMLHRDNSAMHVAEILEPLNQAITEGRVRLLGASNWEYSRVSEANAYADSHGLAGFSVVSNHLSFARAAIPFYPGLIAVDAEGARWHAETGIPLIPWSSQARGFFAGRYHRNMRQQTPDRLDGFTRQMLACYGTDENFERLERATELGAQKGGYTATEVALAWLLHRPFPIVPIVGPHTSDELASCCRALTLKLTQDEQNWLDGLKPEL